MRPCYCLWTGPRLLLPHLCGYAVQAAWLELQGVDDAGPADLSASLDALREQGGTFEKDLNRAGWNTDQVTIRTGTARYL